MNKSFLNKITLVLFIMLAIFGQACKSKKNKKNDVDNKESILSDEYNKMNNIALSIDSANSSFNTLSTKGKALLTINDRRIASNVSIRIKKDELIWASIHTMGMEVARALITNDSVKVLVKVGKPMYFNKRITDLEQYIGSNIGFNELQAILTGNSLNILMNNLTNAKIDSNHYNLYGKLYDVNFNLMFNQQYKPLKLNINNESSQSLVVNYNGYKEIDNIKIPNSIDLRAKGLDQTIGILLSYEKVEVNTNLEYPFTIPKRFKD